MTIKKYFSNHKYIIILLSILILGTFLRFYKLLPNLIFNGEMGRDYLDVWAIIHGTRSFLIGPQTSHEWFFLPPISYWIYAVLMLLAKFSPTVINFFFAAVGSLTILICYYYVKKLFGEKIALISSFLLAVSPIWIDLTRASRYNLPAGIVFFPYLWYLEKSIEDKGKSLAILGLILGISMSFFPSPFLLVPAAIVCFIFYKVKPKIKYILYSVLAFIIPNITFIVYEISDKFQITLQLLAWIPYRILGFFGLYHKNTVNSTILRENVYSIYHFFAESFVPASKVISVTIFLLIVAGSVFWFKKSLKNKRKEISFILILINLVVSYLGLFVHGDPPEHYYYVIFPIPLILVAYLLTKTFKSRFILIFLTILVGVLGIWSLININWFNQDAPLANYPTRPPTYTLQLAVVSEILKDANGSEISIGRIGTYDQFENNFADNYIYLLTIRGAKLNSNAKIRYTIVEERNIGEEAPGKEIWAKDGVQIYKSV